MHNLVNVWSDIGSKKQSYDDDAVDRLSHRYSVVLLVCFALVITSYVYVGKVHTFSLQMELFLVCLCRGIADNTQPRSLHGGHLSKLCFVSHFLFSRGIFWRTAAFSEYKSRDLFCKKILFEIKELVQSLYCAFQQTDSKLKSSLFPSPNEVHRLNPSPFPFEHLKEIQSNVGCHNTSVGVTRNTRTPTAGCEIPTTCPLTTTFPTKSPTPRSMNEKRSCRTTSGCPSSCLVRYWNFFHEKKKQLF